MKINNKGYTLVELLSIIVILGLVIGIGITVVITMLSTSKEKSKDLTKKNIKEQAEKYIYESFADGDWVLDESQKDKEYKCITVKDLIEIGYFKQNIIDENEDIVSENDMIKVTRDTNTKVIVSKDIVSDSLECSQSIETSIIKCSFDTGYAKEKEIEFKFLNSINYQKRLFLNNITYSIMEEYPLIKEEDSEYYKPTTNMEEIHIIAKSNGGIIANTVRNGYQVASLYCMVEGIDGEPPKVTLEAIDNNLTCNIIDEESGVASYKLCQEGSTNCHEENEEGYKDFISNPITRSDAENGKWYCFGKDKAGNTASAEATVNVTESTEINASFIAKEITSSGETNYDGQWTKNKIKLIGTINTNVETWYIINNSNEIPTTGWQTYNNEITQLLTQTINKTFYLHIRYNDNGTMKYITKSLIVKIDKTLPTCHTEIPVNKNKDGITIKYQCIDNESGCKNENIEIYEKVKTDSTYNIEDKVGNKNTCSVTVVKRGYRNYCDEETNGDLGDNKPGTGNNDLGTYRVGCNVVLQDNLINNSNNKICGYNNNSNKCLTKSEKTTLKGVLVDDIDENGNATTPPKSSTYFIDVNESMVRNDPSKTGTEALPVCKNNKNSSKAKTGFWTAAELVAPNKIDLANDKNRDIPYINDTSKVKIEWHGYSCRYNIEYSDEICNESTGFRYDWSKDIGYSCRKVYYGQIVQ